MRIFLCSICLFLLSACASNTGLQTSTKTPDPVVAETSDTSELSGLTAEQWAINLRPLSLANQIKEAEKMYARTNAPAYHREMALHVLATRPGNSTLFAQEALTRLYNSASYDKKVQMEKVLLNEAQAVPTSFLYKVADSLLKEQEKVYPYNVLMWEASKQNLMTTSADIFRRVNVQNNFADYTTFDLRRTASSSAFGENLGTIVINPNPQFEPTCVTLALPMSGNYASVSRQIVSGAQTAQKSMQARNIPIVINIIDTEDATWIEKINNLPAICSVVGGPLRFEVVDTALDAGLLKNRAFFTFLPQLPSNTSAVINALADISENDSNTRRNKNTTPRFTEGKNVWRFFTSPQDQINAILSVAKSSFNVEEFASVYPSGQYGEAMSTLFTEIAGEHGIYVNQVPYDSASSRWWSETLGDFLGAVTPVGGGLPKVNSTIDSVFFIDTWESMQLLAPMLHYQGAVHIPFFGTNLWGQGITSSKNPMTYLDLAIFPGAWNNSSQTYGALKLKKDLSAQRQQATEWSALGFDFVQMVSALDYNIEYLDVKLLNQKLNLLPAIAWSGAPFIWDENGIVERNLFVFQPSERGVKNLNTDELATRHDVRLKEVDNYDKYYQREAQKKLIEERRKVLGY